MAATWTGSALLTRYSQKAGLTDATSLLRITEFMNEIQDNICNEYSWPFLKFRMKKSFASGEQEIDLSPQIPSACVIASGSTGTLTDASTYYVKVTFVLYDSTGLEENSIESESSVASNAITISGSTKLLDVTSIAIYTDATAVYPTTIHRKIYLKKDSGEYLYYSTITNNTATTTQIIADTTSTIEPPYYSMIDFISDEDILDQANGVSLNQTTLETILKYDPGLTATGTPSDYARITKKKVMIYPKLSSTRVFTYYVIRRPARIFNDATRIIQLDPALKTVFDAGVTWKVYEYKDSDGQESKLNNFEELKRAAKERFGRVTGKFGTVTEVN